MAGDAMDFVNKMYAQAESGLRSGDPTTVGILVAIVVVLLTIVFLTCWRRGSKGQAVLLAGLCDAGKTLIFTQLVHDNCRETQTSIKENVGTCELQDGKKQVRIVDLPGHERLRNQFLEQYKTSARGIVFVVDSMNFQKDLKDVADYLYQLLTDPVLSSMSPPILVACNKHDNTMAKGAKVVQSQLEKEINKLRVTQAATLQSTDNTSKKAVFVGKKNKDFEFSDLRNMRVEFVECSAKHKRAGDATLSPIVNWVGKII